MSTLNLPKYRCHKIVAAAKIVAVLPGAQLELEVGDELRIVTVAAPVLKRIPLDCKAKPGYLVEYEDGYLSWSPDDAFKRGYTEIVHRGLTDAEAMLVSAAETVIDTWKAYYDGAVDDEINAAVEDLEVNARAWADSIGAAR